MPTYEYNCKKCRKSFNLVMSMSAHDRAAKAIRTSAAGVRRGKGAAKGPAKRPAKGAAKAVSCPACGCADVAQQLGTFYAKTSKKS
ncbi:MAG: hypothetical protein HY744_24445 [Deltaproteobacteria bacterium]|nr:hypothetical protein [Deltaproteobacteria bacterium]